jgi:hypothetical protein
MKQASHTVPAGYGWPGPEAMWDGKVHYWLIPQDGQDAPEKLFKIMKTMPALQAVMAEHCYLESALEIVDALRQTTTLDISDVVANQDDRLTSSLSFESVGLRRSVRGSRQSQTRP